MRYTFHLLALVAALVLSGGCEQPNPEETAARQKLKQKWDRPYTERGFRSAVLMGDPFEHITKLYLKGGMSPNVKIENEYEEWETPLMMIAQVENGEGYTRVLRMLLDAGADPDIGRSQPDGDLITPLKLAAIYGNPEVTRQLLEAGAKPNNVGKFGHDSSPLTTAALFGHSEMVRLLLEHGADPRYPDPDGTALLLSAENARTVRLLLRYGANPNVQDEGGFTPLMIAAGHGNAAGVQMLLEAGASPNITNENGDTALTAAMREGHTGVARLLKSRGAYR